MSSKASIDRELEELLAGGETELSRLYRKLPQAEPDAKLDDAVIAMAHRALNPQLVAMLKREELRKPRSRWLVGLGSAAGIVLAAGVALQLRHGLDQGAAPDALQEASEARKEQVIRVTPIDREAPPLPEPAPPAPPPFSSSVSPAAAAAPAKAAPKPAAELARRRDEPVKQDRSELDKQDRDDAKTRAKDGMMEYTLPAGPAGKAPQPTPFPQSTSPGLGVTATPAPPPAPRAPPAPAVAVEPASTPSEKAEAFGEPEQAAEEIDSVERKAARAAGAARPPATSAAGEGRRSTDESPVEVITTTGAPMADAPSGGVGNLAPARSATLLRNSRLAPAEWAAVISQLLRDGRRDEAMENLHLLRDRHPDFALPRDLRDLER